MAYAEGPEHWRNSQIRMPWLVRYFVIDRSKRERLISPPFRTLAEASKQLEMLRDRYPNASVICRQFSPSHYCEDDRGNIVRTVRH